MPLAATITSPEIEAICAERGFLFYTTHVSDPLPARIGLKAIEIILRDRLTEHAARMGDRLRTLTSAAQASPTLSADAEDARRTLTTMARQAWTLGDDDDAHLP